MEQHSDTFLLLPAYGGTVEAWEPGKPAGDHATITYHAGRWWGLIRTRRPVGSFMDLPGGHPERVAGVHAHYKAVKELAQTLGETAR